MRPEAGATISWLWGTRADGGVSDRLGCGDVGVSAALNWQHRGHDVALLDQRGPGEATSFGHDGLIQSQAMNPHRLPRSLPKIQRIAANKAMDVQYHLGALPGSASPLLKYWWHMASAGRANGQHPLDGCAPLRAGQATRCRPQAASAKRPVRL